MQNQKLETIRRIQTCAKVQVFFWTSPYRKITDLDRGWTNRINLTHGLDHDLQSNPLPAMVMAYSYAKVHGKWSLVGQSVPKIEWKQMDGQTDGWTDEQRRLHYHSICTAAMAYEEVQSDDNTTTTTTTTVLQTLVLCNVYIYCQ